MSDILSYFPSNLEPRDLQVKALEFIQKNWNKADVLVLNLPVASGKSAISWTLQRWLGQGSTAILTNNNILVEQYKSTYPKLHAAYGKGAVSCMNTAEEGSEFSSCAERYSWVMAQDKPRRKYCKDCPYYRSMKRFMTPSKFNYVTNYYKYVSLVGQYQNKGARHNLVIDEAHNLAGAIKSFNAKHLWLQDFNYLECLDKYGRLDRDEMLERLALGLDHKQPDWLRQELASSRPKYIFSMDKDIYRGKEMPVLRAEPVDIRGLKNPIWHTSNKLVLMSGTISKNDIVELGLDTRRVAYHEADSCIPAERRPINFEPVAAIKGRDLRQTLPLVKDKILSLLDQYQDKGLIHATYAQAELLRAALGGHERLRFHTRENKKQVYQEFRDGTEGQVLVASGLYEGVDLPDDLGRWQVLSKVPWPNKGEPAIAYASDIDPNWYTWSTAKQVLQACGRICRHPEDRGDTYIIDSTFKNLYSGNQEYWPKWWRESVNGI